MEENTKEFLDRFRAEVEGQGLSLRQMDDALEVGIRHKFHKGTKRALEVDDYFRGTAALKLDPFRLLARIAGYGDPFDITALRGSRAPVWPPEQKDILDSLEDLKRAGGAGFEEIRQELRRLEHLHDDEPQAAEQAMWEWLAHERRPGAVVGLLAALAVHQKKTKAHALLELGNTILGEEVDNAAGGKLITAAGRCFIAAGFAREGLHIFRKHALEIVDLFGDADEHAAVHYHISRAAARLGQDLLCKRALQKAVALGRDRLRCVAMQLLAYKELGANNYVAAIELYDELLTQPDFCRFPKQFQAAVQHSRLAAKSLAGQLNSESIPTFAAAVRLVKELLPARERVAAAMDYSAFLRRLGRDSKAAQILEDEIWIVTELDDKTIVQKFAGLWEELRLPRDARWQTLIGRLEGSDEDAT